MLNKILKSIIERSGGSVNRIDFAKRLKYWISHGFPELGDLGGCGIGETVMVNFNLKLKLKFL